MTEVSQKLDSHPSVLRDRSAPLKTLDYPQENMMWQLEPFNGHFQPAVYMCASLLTNFDTSIK